MKTKMIDIEEFNFKIDNTRNVLHKVINSQINNYKLQYLTDWESDHSISSNTKDEKIKALEEKKDSLNVLLSEFDTKTYLVDFKISIDLTIKKKSA